MTKLFYPNASSMTVRLGYPLADSKLDDRYIDAACERRWTQLDIGEKVTRTHGRPGAWVEAWVFVPEEFLESAS